MVILWEWGDRGLAGQGHQVVEELEPQIHPINAGVGAAMEPRELRLQAPGACSLSHQTSLTKQKFKDKIIKNSGMDCRALNPKNSREAS